MCRQLVLARSSIMSAICFLFSALEAVTACSSEERSEYIACCSQPGGSFLAKQSSSSEALESEDPGEDTACETPGFNRLLNGACLVNDVERVQSWT